MEDFVLQTIVKLRQALSNYDVMTVLFQSLTAADEQKNLKLHSQWRRTRPHGVTLSQIVELMSGHPVKDFLPGLRELIKLYEEGGADTLPLMVQTLLCFDNELSELTPPRQRTNLLTHGPMNSVPCQELTGAYLYLSPQEAIQGNFLAEYGLRRGGKLLASHPSGLQRKLSNYTVISQNRLGAMVPQVHAYYPSDAVQTALRTGPLRIVVCSFANFPWFDVRPTSSGAEFDILYTPDQDRAIAEAFAEFLTLAEMHEADIVVFPEMALGASARRMIQRCLIETSRDRRHIKLIFAGTEWLNGENTAYIFSADGTRLLTQRKREPFDWYNKETRVSMRENLTDHRNLLQFLDVAGLGRIAYSVCRDFLDSHENIIRADMLGSSLHIASCYTGELGSFSAVAEALVKQYGAVVLVVNSCSATQMKAQLKNRPVVGFFAVPTCTSTCISQKQIGCDLIPYTIRSDSCASGDCRLCSCMDFYTLYRSPQKISVVHEKF